jgi:vesicular inhibitory amino acid transporter
MDPFSGGGFVHEEFQHEEHGRAARKSTTLQTALNMFNELEGTGLLGLPYAIKLGGWGAVACMAVAGCLAAYTGVILCASMYDDRGRRVCMSYGDLGAHHFGARGGAFVLWMQRFNMLMVGVVFLVLIGSTLQSAYPLFDGPDSSSIISSLGVRAYSAAATVLVLPTVHIGGFQSLAHLSTFSILLLTAAIVLVLVSCTNELQAAAQSGGGPAGAVEWRGAGALPAVFAIFVFAFSAHGIFPELQAGMEQPQQFAAVTAAVFSTNFVLKAGFSLAAFLAYGASTQQVISSNLPRAAMLAISVCVSVNTALTFPLPLSVFFASFESGNGGGVATTPSGGGGGRDGDDGGAINGGASDSGNCNGGAPDTRPSKAPPGHGSRGRRRFTGTPLFRTLIVLACGIVAMAVPDFAVVMGLAGSGPQMCLTFIFPALFYVKARRLKCGSLHHACCMCAVAVGVFGSVSGFVSSLRLLIR